MFKLVIFNHWIVSQQEKIHSEIDEEPPIQVISRISGSEA